MTPKIEDEFTDLPIPRQRKYYLRNKAKHREWNKKYEQSEKGKQVRRAIRERSKLKEVSDN